MIDPRAAMQKHDVAYLTAGGHNNAVNSGIKRVDYLNGKTQFFDFGADVVAGEPVFAARPGGGHDEGWLIVQCSTAGPSVRSLPCSTLLMSIPARLRASICHTALPISFHGWWKAD